MSVFTVIVTYNICEHCSGTGTIEELVDCEVCEGQCSEHPTSDGQCCTHCLHGQVEASSIQCSFCKNLRRQHIEQFEAASVDQCGGIVMNRLAKKFGYNPSIDLECEFCDLMDIPGVRNAWDMMLGDDSGRYECMVVKTNLSED